MPKRELTEKQKKFLDVLFEEEENGGAAGDALKAKYLAGYSPSTLTSEVVRSLEDEIFEETKKYFARVAPQAAFKITGIMKNPVGMGTKVALDAAKDLLDRGGHTKTEKLEVSGSGGVFILPSKEEQENEESS
jgi:hypothetical protein